MQGSGSHRTVLKTRARTHGFTLIELMIVVVIVSILLAIAIPGYSSYMRKSRRSDTEATMMDIAQREQQYLNDTRAYAPDTTTLAGGGTTLVPGDVSAYYTITICQAPPPAACNPPGGAPPTFVVVATPIAGTPQAADPVLTLDNTGARAPASVW
jgi:type IV pilus assembly protein PilE